jgi:hypothetical protein
VVGWVFVGESFGWLGGWMSAANLKCGVSCCYLIYTACADTDYLNKTSWYLFASTFHILPGFRN